jgi:hypothetical protein
MIRTRFLSSLTLGLILGAMPVAAGPISHAMELDPEGAVYFVDVERGRLLRYEKGSLSVFSELSGVTAGGAMQNLIRTVDGELYLGQKKAVWKLSPTGAVEAVKPPAELKNLFKERPGDLAPDGSVYVARDYRTIERALPGGDAHPVLTTDVISKIHSMSATPYGRVFFANNSEIAKLDAEGEITIFQELEGDKVLGLAAVGENAVLVLRQSEGAGLRLEHLDALGKTRELVSAEQIAAVTMEQPVDTMAKD